MGRRSAPIPLTCDRSFHVAAMAAGGVIKAIGQVLDGTLANAPWCFADLRVTMPNEPGPWGFAYLTMSPLAPWWRAKLWALPG